MKARQLQQQLIELTKDLYYMSESDYPYEVLIWEHVSKKDVENHISGLRDYGGLIEVVQARDFFKKIIDNYNNSNDDALIKMAVQYEKLYDFIKANSSNVKVWRCGRIEIDIYIVVESADGQLVVLKTTSIET